MDYLPFVNCVLIRRDLRILILKHDELSGLSRPPINDLFLHSPLTTIIFSPHLFPTDPTHLDQSITLDVDHLVPMDLPWATGTLVTAAQIVADSQV